MFLLIVQNTQLLSMVQNYGMKFYSLFQNTIKSKLLMIENETKYFEDIYFQIHLKF